MLREDPARFSATYRILLHAARAEGIGPARLVDFLGLEQGGDLALLGQEELNVSVLEAALRDQVTQQSGTSVWSDLETERILLAAARVGQHVFAQHVLANCGSRCVFCGLRPASFGATRMLLARHIKPWKDSSPAERFDPRNGLAVQSCQLRPVTRPNSEVLAVTDAAISWPWPGWLWGPARPTRRRRQCTGPECRICR